MSTAFLWLGLILFPQDKTAPEAMQDLPAKAQEESANPIYERISRFGQNVYIGGYMDLEYWYEDGGKNTFDQHRFVPFFYADVSDHVKLAVELEIEHGEEVGIEFGTIDYWFTDAINFRAGIILNPLGKFNLVHDAPYQDLTQRPLVDQWVIPAVLRDPGVGFFGSFDADPWVFSYEVYLVNGFKGLDDAGSSAINTSQGLRGARPHGDQLGSGNYRDFNDNKAVVGRFTVSPFLGLELGASFHMGKYDEAGDLDLNIFAFDFTLSGGGLHNALFSGGNDMLRDILFAMELVGEFAYADIDQNDLSKAAGVPEKLDGYYVELRYHFMPRALRSVIPGASDESTFTAVVRWDDTDLDGSGRDSLTFGLNFRPREDTVFKFEYSIRGESGDVSETDNDVFAFSVGTYF